jgi:hypothetical protein
MEELLGGILEILVDFLFELAVELLASGAARGVRKGSRHLRKSYFGREELNRPFLVAISLFIGIFAGIGSIVLHPNPFFRPIKVHGISLVLSPLLTGLVMACIGSMLRRRNRKPVPWESFWGGFAFALGMAVIRFLSTR